MAYIPPHKRYSASKVKRVTPIPESFVPRFQRNLNLRSSKPNHSERGKDKRTLPGGKITYARDSISRWWVVAFTDVDTFPFSVRLEPISLESIERKFGEKPLALVSDHPSKELIESSRRIGESPWMSIAEKIQADLLTSFENVRNEMEFQESQVVKPSFVARFGKILFHGSPSIDLDTSGKCSDVETALSQVKRTFYTNICSSYMETIEGDVIPKIGVEFEEEKEYYHVKVADNTQPDATISCKCSVMKDDGGLEIHKIELNQIRHLVVDISCLDKNLDLRVMVTTKRILTELTDDEKNALRILIKSAVIDPDVKGGLRWPLGKESFGDRYSIVGVWHTKAKAFKNSSMRLKLRHADRFDFKTSTGEASKEVILRMTGISGHLRDQMVEPGSLMEMLQDALKLIWDNFLDLDCTF